MNTPLSPLALPISLGIMCILTYIVYRWAKKSNKEMKGDDYPSAKVKRIYPKEVDRLLEMDECEYKISS